MRVEWDGSALLLIGSIDDPVGDPDEFTSKLRELVQSGRESIGIEFRETKRAFPNARVPIAATINHYRNQGIDFILNGESRTLNVSTIIEPISVESSSTTTLSRVCQFDHKDAHVLAEWVIDDIQREAEFAVGSIDAFHWCLWEVMDNVANHSEAETGILEVQLHRIKKHLAICIADAGLGIKETMSQKGRASLTDEDAIMLVMEYGVTRDPRRFQGNGLWGLQKVVRASKGILNISSGSGRVTIDGESSTHRAGRVSPGPEAAGTVIDFQVAYNKPINFAQIIGQQLQWDLGDRLLDESNRYVIRVSKEARGYATRKSGEQMYYKTRNILKAISGQIVLDFGSIRVISSSFADEFIGKMVREMGFLQFNNYVRIVNIDPAVEAAINQAVRRRLEEPQRPARLTDAEC